MSFENQINQWIILDNQLRIANERVKELRERRSNIGKNITDYANNKTDKIPFTGGHLKIVNTRVHEQLTFSYLERSLREIIKNESQINIILEHIRNKREVKIVPEIKRFID